MTRRVEVAGSREGGDQESCCSALSLSFFQTSLPTPLWDFAPQEAQEGGEEGVGMGGGIENKWMLWGGGGFGPILSSHPSPPTFYIATQLQRLLIDFKCN